jgi:ParB/RepB/Spo0J family partition protein
MKIPLAEITDRRKVNRREVDTEYIRGLAASMEANGLIQPIAVRPWPEGGYDLIAGANRVAAAQLLNWPDIEADVQDRRGSITVATLEENVRRKNLSVIEESDAVVAMHEEQGWGINEIAERIRHSNSWVTDRLAIANYPENFKSALHRRKITIGGANQLMLVEDIEIRDYWLHLAEVNGATVQQCEAWYLGWKSQRMLSHPEGQGPPISQPMPFPLLPKIACFTCGDPVENVSALVVRICIPCHDTIKLEKDKALYEAALAARAGTVAIGSNGRKPA